MTQKRTARWRKWIGPVLVGVVLWTMATLGAEGVRRAEALAWLQEVDPGFVWPSDAEMKARAAAWVAEAESRGALTAAASYEIPDEVEAADLARADEAAGCVVVTTGEFTEAAARTGRARRVGLVDGTMLGNMIREARKATKKERSLRARIARWIGG